MAPAVMLQLTDPPVVACVSYSFQESTGAFRWGFKAAVLLKAKTSFIFARQQ